MIDAHLSLAHRFVLMTDEPGAAFDPLIEPVKIWDDWRSIKNAGWGATKPQCYVRLKAFSREAEAIFGPRFVSMDLDCVVLKSLDPLFSRTEDFLIFRRMAASAREALNTYNGSMWMMNTGARAKVWEDFRGQPSILAAAKYMGTDQAWIRHKLGPNERGWDVNDGVYGWPRIRNDAHYRNRPPEQARIIFFYGGQKPWAMFPPRPAFAPVWRRRPLPADMQPPKVPQHAWVTEIWNTFTTRSPAGSALEPSTSAP